MNTAEKVEFVESFTNAVKLAVLDDILTGKIPEDWNGLQLRVYIAEAFAAEAAYSRKSIGRGGMRAINNQRATAPLKY